MKLGIAKALAHNTAREWAKKHSDLGLSAVVFPVNCNAEKQKIIDDFKSFEIFNIRRL